MKNNVNNMADNDCRGEPGDMMLTKDVSMICDELPVTPRVHRVLPLFYPSYRVNACFHHCTTHTVYNCPTHITHPS